MVAGVGTRGTTQFERAPQTVAGARTVEGLADVGTGVVAGESGAAVFVVSWLTPILVAAGEACVRLRSSRKSCMHDVPVTPQCLKSRLLRGRTQASPAATETAPI